MAMNTLIIIGLVETANATALEWLKVIADPLSVVLAAIGAVAWGHIYWRKQKLEEGKYLQRNAQYQSEVNAAKAVWGLLRYISESDHDDNILRRGEMDEEGNKIYYFRPKQATLFMKELMELFYTQGHGLFIDKDTKLLIFELRSQMYGWYHVATKSKQDEMKITNKEKLHRIVVIREELNKRLKEQTVIH